jgi:chromosomal replication initiation ATPase DnaA
MAQGVTIEVDEETAALLSERARAAGKSVAEYLREVTGSSKPTRRPLTIEERRAAMEEWINSHESRNPNMDDSRESIYEGRGE